jgi:hypothetical protein
MGRSEQVESGIPLLGWCIRGECKAKQKMWFGKIIVSKADQQLGVQCEGVVVMVSGLTRLETGCIKKRSRDRLHEQTERHKGNGGENETQRFKVA